MYICTSIIILLVGIIVLFITNKRQKNRKTSMVVKNMIGIVLIIFGVAALFMLLSGRITLPLK